MRALSSHFVLIDLHSSWHYVTQIPTSAFGYRESSRLPTSFSAALRRTRRRRNGISSSTSPARSIRSPEIRRPRDRSSPGNGLSSVSSSTISTSTSEVVSELELFLELVPLRMRNELFRHPEIGDLIEIVLDFGRQPLARFPSGDWVNSEQPVMLEDLRQAISKVIQVNSANN